METIQKKTASEIQAEEYEKSVKETMDADRRITAGKEQEIAGLLAHKQYDEISALLKNNMATFMHSPKYAEIAQLVQIYDIEALNDMPNRIFDISNDLSEILCIWRALKFQIFRIQFNVLSDEGNELCNITSKYGISLPALDKLVEWNSVGAFDVYLAMARIFMKNGMLEYSLHMLRGCQRLEPDRKDILSLMYKVSMLIEKAEGNM